MVKRNTWQRLATVHWKPINFPTVCWQMGNLVRHNYSNGSTFIMCSGLTAPNTLEHTNIIIQVGIKFIYILYMYKLSKWHQHYIHCVYLVVHIFENENHYLQGAHVRINAKVVATDFGSISIRASAYMNSYIDKILKYQMKLWQRYEYLGDGISPTSYRVQRYRLAYIYLKWVCLKHKKCHKYRNSIWWQPF